MTFPDLIEFLDFTRARSLGSLDAIAAMPDPHAVLAWRPAPGRAHAAWQLMHLGATDDRHLTIRMQLKDAAAHPEYVRRFAGGSTPDDTIPTVDEIRGYLAERRAALIAFLHTLSPEMIAVKPSEKAYGPYGEWLKLLAWHEAHHQGQLHITLNLYKAAHAGV